jgi:hypothetical protein
MGRPPGVLCRHRAHDRLRIALAGSALLHLLGASALVPEISTGRARGNGDSVPITVQLERAPLAPAATAASVQVPRRPRAAPAPEFRVGHAAPARECCSGPPRLPAPADPTIYTAGELDSLPVPVAPLDLASAAPVRLELTIDEYGAVHSIAIAGPRPGLRERELRAALAATVFVPARKDGRSVRSRIVLGVE